MDSDIKKKYMKAGKIARRALDLGVEECKPGVSYFDLSEKIEEYIYDKGAKMAFPVNISVDEIGAHYTPYPDDGKVFKKGDVVKVDVGCHIDGYIADNAMTKELGTSKHDGVIKAAEEGLDIAMKTLRPGMKSGDIGQNIETVIRSRGYRPIENLTGHEVSKYSLHSGTSIPNVSRGRDKIKTGMVLAIEPFATKGKGRVKDWKKSEIYRLLEPRNLKGDDLEFYNWMKKEFDRLPFASHWCRDYSSEYKNKLNRLKRFRTVMDYPVLIEEKKGIVSQREHTAIVTSSGAKITTKARR
ncbi:MAG: type II methionyl aminopeptidase [Thermoplasmatota archaeon]